MSSHESDILVPSTVDPAAAQDIAQLVTGDRVAMADVGVLGLMGHRWGGQWKGAMQVFTRLARYFRVVWVNPPQSWRSAEWRRRWLQPRHARGKDCFVPAPGLTVCESPLASPAVGGPAMFDNILARRRWSPARNLLHQWGCQKTVAYLWRPNYAIALDVLQHDASCYHINDEYTFSTVEQPLGQDETALISRVNQVFVHSPQLKEKKGHINPNTLVVPNGVDYRRFATPTAEPEDLSRIPHPRIGYVGKIKTQLDLALLLQLARQHDQWSFVFVGPHKALRDSTDVFRELTGLPNVHCLGDKPVDELPGYVQHMDVNMLCYQVNDYTKFIYPLKLHEYLAGGRPVVGAPIRTLHEFRDIIELASTREEWSTALSAALADAEMDPSRVARRRAVAQAHDWDQMVIRIARAICGQLGPDYLERFDQLDHPAQEPERP